VAVMGFLEWFTIITGAATLISLAIGLSSLWNGKATRALIREMQAETKGLLAGIDQRWREAFERTDRNAEGRYRDLRRRITGEA
jgi:hypothetical protein